ncbi:sulfatase [Fuerstiella marisgermanici]|uniref:Choline-sulfatase n=1 Tax=Fuerstiella marisgermanici TaxID=1891926 RepID=A0A1P8WB75_9PLAN|nr:sulfatase [Fuerstiella marisgermanici]APZ91283.1 Choline-sulfatase [Fuerstiella marisgermanici]
MKRLALIFTFLLADFCAAQSPNVLLICVDDLRPELGCYGVDYISSPNIDGLAQRGRIFRRHYVQAPTCGASRYTLLTGRYGPADNGALFARAKQVAAKGDQVPPSMPEWFRQNGYVTAAVGKVSHHPGGLGGPDWNDPSTVEMPTAWDHQLLPAGPWKHPRGWMHGLANGEIRTDAGKMDVLQATEGDDSIYPDGPSVDAALALMQQLAGEPSQDANRKPFFLACGILRPHLPFGAPAKYVQRYDGVDLPPIPHPDKPQGKTTWHGSGEFMKYNRWGKNPNTDAEFATQVRTHYAACVSYADAQVGRLLDKLDELKLRDDTLIVLWGDHGWHLGEHAVWGKHTLFEESLRSPLIVSYAKLRHPGTTSDAMVETLDIFPTLTDLANLPTPDHAHGVSLRPILTDPKAPGHDAFAYRRNIKTIRTNNHRLILHKDGHAELYDHRTPKAETVNVADSHPDVVAELSTRIQKRLGDGQN